MRHRRPALERPEYDLHAPRLTARAQAPPQQSVFAFDAASSSPVASVDLDVPFRKVTSEESSAARSALLDSQINCDAILVKFGLQGWLIHIDRQACPANRHVLQQDRDLARIELNSGVTRGCQNSAPVRIAASNRGLDQRRVRDAPGDLSRFRFRFEP